MKYKIFKPGKYPQGEITEQDIIEIVNSYDTSFHKAPLTLDHAQTGPAHGYVSELAVAPDGSLVASFENLSDEIIELTQKGRYQKPSIELAEYDGKKYLRAVSLVMFPQVKGLPDIKFNDNPVSIYFNESLSIKFNNKTMDNLKFFDKYQLLVPKDTDFTGLDKIFYDFETKIKALNEEIEKLKKENDEYKLKFNEQFVQNLINSGKATPAQKETLLEFASLDFETFKKFAESLPILPIFEKDKTKSITPDSTKDPKFFKEDGSEITYSDILKNPSLQSKFTAEEIEQLRSAY